VDRLWLCSEASTLGLCCYIFKIQVYFLESFSTSLVHPGFHDCINFSSLVILCNKIEYCSENKMIICMCVHVGYADIVLDGHA